MSSSFYSLLQLIYNVLPTTFTIFYNASYTAFADGYCVFVLESDNEVTLLLENSTLPLSTSPIASSSYSPECDKL